MYCENEYLKVIIFIRNGTEYKGSRIVLFTVPQQSYNMFRAL